MSKVDIQFNLRVPSELKEKIEVSAQHNNRSINAEAVSRLYNSFSESQQNLSASIKAFEEMLRQNRPSSRRTKIAARLNISLEKVNEALTYSKKLSPARIAKNMGNNYAEPMENFFMGLEEPSFSQLENIAEYLNINSDWLLFGEGSIFSISYSRVPTPEQDGVNWLTDKNLNNNLTHLYFLRQDSEAGELIIIKQYGNWHCTVFKTPYHISEVIGATGESNLIRLFSTWKLLDKQSPPPSVRSFLISPKDYQTILSGETHPLTIINQLTDKPWWEDIWDHNVYEKMDYWDGWKSLCRRINNLRKS